MLLHCLTTIKKKEKAKATIKFISRFALLNFSLCSIAVLLPFDFDLREFSDSELVFFFDSKQTLLFPKEILKGHSTLIVISRNSKRWRGKWETERGERGKYKRGEGRDKSNIKVR